MTKKVTEFLSQAKKPLFTFEVLPPLKGTSIENLYEAIEPLMEFNPSYINVTFHQQEEQYNKRPDGFLEKTIVRKRPGTVAISAAIKNKFNIPIVPHLICGGATKEDIENALLELHFLEINNVLALRGDAAKGQRGFKAEENGHSNASDMVSQIKNLNKGIYTDEKIQNKTKTDFCIGVAGYPEKHMECANLQTDLIYLKKKVDAGADYIVTQMFFDNQKYFDFVNKCREIGINVPIIPGIKPIANFADVKLIPHIFSIDIPYEFTREIDKCKNNDEVFQLGVEWAIQQSKELIKFGVPSLHYFTIGKSKNIKLIAKEIF